MAHTAMKRHVLLLLAPLLFLANCRGQSCRDNNTLEFLFMTSFGAAFNSSGSAIGAMMAMERINANDTILPNHKLIFDEVIDTECDRTVSLTRYHEQIRSNCNPFIAVIGSGCSVATEPIAEISHFFGLSQLSYGSSANNLGDRRRFRNHFQLHPTEANYLPAIAATIAYYGWTQVGIITQNENIFTGSVPIIHALLNSYNVTVLDSVSFDSDQDPARVDGIFAQYARVFFLNTYEDKARQVICAAYHNNLYGEYYHWITFGWYNLLWWEETEHGDSPFNCTNDQLYQVLKGSFAIRHFPINEDTEKVVLGNLSYLSFRQEFTDRLDNSNYLDSIVAHIAYDAVWNLAMVLHEVNEKILENDKGNCTGELLSLNDWMYSDSNSATSCLIRSILANTNFEGLSGYIRFHENGTRQRTPVRIYIIDSNAMDDEGRRTGLLQVARYGADNVYVYVNGASDATVFPDGIPLDGRPIEHVLTFHVALIATLYSLSFICLIFCGVCVAFIVIFRKKRIIRLTSSNLDYLILAGAVLILLSVFTRLYPYDTYVSALVCCIISLFLTFIGYTLTFGTILAKMWRIYYIFHNPTTSKKKLTDLHLVGISLVIVLVMVALLIVGVAVPDTRPDPYLVLDKENPSTLDERGIIQIFYIYRCYPQSAIPWQIVLFIYLGMLQIVALILAIQTRKVHIKVLNDSKEVAAIIYITSIVLVLLIIVTFTLDDYQNVREALYSGGLIVVAVVVLICIFVTKMYRLYRDPNGEKIFCTANNSSVDITSSGVMSIVSDKDRIARLEAKIQHLTSTLTDLQYNNGQTANGNSRPERIVSFSELPSDLPRVSFSELPSVIPRVSFSEGSCSSPKESDVSFSIGHKSSQNNVLSI